MPTNEQRRETAKRKLERQLERRAENERKRRMYTIIGSAAAAVVVRAVGDRRVQDDPVGPSAPQDDDVEGARPCRCTRRWKPS